MATPSTMPGKTSGTVASWSRRPAPEIERSRPIPLARDARVFFGAARESAVEIQQHRHQNEQNHRERAGMAELRRHFLDTEEDVGRQHADPARDTDQRRHLERLD